MKILLALLVLISLGCRGAQDIVAPDTGEGTARQQAIARISDELEASPLFDAVLTVATLEGEPLVFTKGTTSTDNVYNADSAQKWVAATALLREARARGVDEDTPLLSYPNPLALTGDAARVTLRQMLSSTAGWEAVPLCGRRQSGALRDCAQRIVDAAHTSPTRFYYGTHHMLPAAASLVDDDESFTNIFARMQAETGLFLSSSYRSAEKPLAFRTTAAEYMAFLKALQAGDLLDDEVRTRMLTAQTLDVDVASSPADRVEQGWRYGYGNWVHCDSTCDTQHHSAGARGFYPWIDTDDDTRGVIAFNSGLGDWEQSHALYRAIRADIKIALGLEAPAP